jgi:spermidine synthase
VTVHATDGIEFIKNHQNEYDIIAVDSTDPEDFAAGLFKEEFYHYVFSALTAQGIMVAQTENPFFDEFNIRDIYDNLRKVFPNVQSYWGPISIYPGTFWTFAFASKGPKGTDILEQKKLEVRGFQKDLKWYNLNWHQSAFQLSNIHSRITGVTT